MTELPDSVYLRAAMAYYAEVEASAADVAARPRVDLAAAQRLLEQRRAEAGIVVMGQPRAEGVDRRTLPPGPSWEIRNAIRLQDGRRADIARFRHDLRPIAPIASSQDGPGQAQRAKIDQFPTDTLQRPTEAENSAVGLRLEGASLLMARIAPAMAAYCLDYDHGRL